MINPFLCRQSHNVFVFCFLLFFIVDHDWVQLFIECWESEHYISSLQLSRDASDHFM